MNNDWHTQLDVLCKKVVRSNMVNFISPIEAIILVRKREKGHYKYDAMYVFLSPKIIILSLKITLLEEAVASSSEPTLDHSNLAKV
jgi:hypothetical protein